MFKTWWDSVFDLFFMIINSLTNILTFLRTPIYQLTSFFSLPGWIANFLSNIIANTNLGQYSVLSLMLGVGLPLFIALTIIKYILDVLP